MAFNLCGKSRNAVDLDYKFEYQFRDLDQLGVGESVLSSTFTHDGASWQLELQKVAIRGGLGQRYFECQLQLVTLGNEKSKLARICPLLPNSEFRTASLYQQSGDKSESVTFPVKMTMLEIYIAVEVIKYVKIGNPNSPIHHPLKSQWATQVLKWFQTEDFGDVTISAADGKKFRCHRDILARRSEVFRLMFKSGMKDARENLVDIEDFDGEIVSSLLLFIYTDECEIGPTADRLYAAAHQYQLERLKILCESSLGANLSANSIVKTYRLARFYHLDKLLASCVDYLDTHKAELSTADLLAEALDMQEGNEVQLAQQ